jgi:hypothetical protein
MYELKAGRVRSCVVVLLVCVNIYTHTHTHLRWCDRALLRFFRLLLIDSTSINYLFLCCVIKSMHFILEQLCKCKCALFYIQNPGADEVARMVVVNLLAAC